MKKKSKSQAGLYASLKKKITRWIAEAQKKLLLQAWTIKIVWKLDEEESGDRIAIMSIEHLPEYNEAVVEVFIKNCFQYSDKLVRNACYHEMFHAVLSDYSKLADSRYASKVQLDDAEEKLVSTLAKIIAG
jgi:hypothetical protein